ncbi:hypothetical protein EJB05_16804, partial [Eragrostis curvula]
MAVRFELGLESRRFRVGVPAAKYFSRASRSRRSGDTPSLAGHALLLPRRRLASTVVRNPRPPLLPLAFAFHLTSVKGGNPSFPRAGVFQFSARVLLPTTRGPEVLLRSSPASDRPRACTPPGFRSGTRSFTDGPRPPLPFRLPTLLRSRRQAAATEASPILLKFNMEKATFGPLDITGLLVSLVLTWATKTRVQSVTRASVTVGDMLTAPLLGVHDHGHAAKRCQYWLLATFFHSLTMISYVCKDHGPSEGLWDWILFFKCLGHLLNLIGSFLLLILLARHYPITEDLLVAGIIVGFGFISYLLIFFTDKMCLEGTIGQSTRFELIPFSIALLGVIPGILCLIPRETSDASGVLSAVFEQLMKHLPFNVNE